MLFVCFTLMACASRYRLDLFMALNGSESRVKVESSEFAANCALGDPFSDMKTVVGSTSCLVISVKGRGNEIEQTNENIVRFDEYTTVRLYVELPEMKNSQSINLIDNSFAHQLGRYDIPAEEKVYLPTFGSLVMDSVIDDRLFATIHGRFATHGGKTLAIDGQFKVRVAR